MKREMKIWECKTCGRRFPDTKDLRRSGGFWPGAPDHWVHDCFRPYSLPWCGPVEEKEISALERLAEQAE